MASIQWVCDSCSNADEQEPWECPGCGNETCENCFSAFAHCKKCSEGKTDEELRIAANNAGYDFEPDEPKKSIIQQAGDILAKCFSEHYALQDGCEKCGGTGWIEPEFGDASIDIPYRCDHKNVVEIVMEK